MTATVDLGGRSYPVYDLAMNGVSVLTAKGDFPLKVGEQARARVLLATDVVFDGQVRVARFDDHFRKERVGLQLLCSFLDLPRLETLARDRELNLGLLSRPEALRARLPEPILDVIERIAHYLAYYKELIDHHEARLCARSEAPEEQRHALAMRTADAMREGWNHLRTEASDLTADSNLDSETRAHVRSFTRTLLGHLVSTSPLVTRALENPLGYPGDHRLIMQVYANRHEGATAFGAALSKLACEEPLALGAHARKEQLVRLQGSELDRFDTAGTLPPFKIASLACGPAREISELILQRKFWPCRVEWTLIDREEDALSLAHQEIHRAIATCGAPLRAHCLFLPFSHFLRDPRMLTFDEPQDMIYTAGLVNHLSTPVARTLIRSLFGQLRPGRLLAIGNAPPACDPFFIEYLCNWSLNYRSERELLALAEALPQVQASVETAPGGANHLLLLRSP